MDKIHQATIMQEDWVETSPEIIHHYNRKGLGNAKYFIFQGIKVCEFGASEAIQADLDRPMGEILYGKEEGIVKQGYDAKHVVPKGMT